MTAVLIVHRPKTASLPQTIASQSACRRLPVRTFTQNEPLTDAELDRLGDFLKSCKGGHFGNGTVIRASSPGCVSV